MPRVIQTRDPPRGEAAQRGDRAARLPLGLVLRVLEVAPQGPRGVVALGPAAAGRAAATATRAPRRPRWICAAKAATAVAPAAWAVDAGAGTKFSDARRLSNNILSTNTNVVSALPEAPPTDATNGAPPRSAFKNPPLWRVNSLPASDNFWRQRRAQQASCVAVAWRSSETRSIASTLSPLSEASRGSAATAQTSASRSQGGGGATGRGGAYGRGGAAATWRRRGRWAARTGGAEAAAARGPRRGRQAPRRRRAARSAGARAAAAALAAAATRFAAAMRGSGAEAGHWRAPRRGRVVDGALAVLGGHLAPELRFVVAPGRQDGVDLGQVRRVVALVEGR